MNVLGFVESLMSNFGLQTGTSYPLLPQNSQAGLLYGSVLLLLCTALCLISARLFNRAAVVLFAVILLSTITIPLSPLLLIVPAKSAENSWHTGYSMDKLRGNLWPRFTRGAVGSSNPNTEETFQSVFGILFPATAGIFAGASMSGDLRKPSRSIPCGTLYGLGITFVLYTLVLMTLGASVTRESLYTEINILQKINALPAIILLGALSTSFFSALLGVMSCAKLLQAIARDRLFNVFNVFASGASKTDMPRNAILATYLMTQIILFTDLNRIASFVTMTNLLTFIITNWACFLLKLSSAPNFRPTFRFFHWSTAAMGALLCLFTMYFVDAFYATLSLAVMASLFVLIHYVTPPKPWGDVTQSLIYHQVRKYLLRLDSRKEHVKFWRPQILLMVNDPRSAYRLVQFCNSLKKGALYILGHVIVIQEGSFQDNIPELCRQRAAWTDLVRISHVKAFTQVALSESVLWGTRNLILNAGLGGLSPNIVVMGFFDLDRHGFSTEQTDRNDRRRKKVCIDADKQLPTDSNKEELKIGLSTWVTLVEDILHGLNLNIAIAKGFDELELPGRKTAWRSSRSNHKKKYIDLWPIQMATETLETEGSEFKVMSIFDTFMMILQLGSIIHSVDLWKSYTLRLFVFVEHEVDVKEERDRVCNLLSMLRIEAELHVLYLASGEFWTYNSIINGAPAKNQTLEDALSSDAWWQDIKQIRAKDGTVQNCDLGDQLRQIINFRPRHNRQDPIQQRFRRRSMQEFSHSFSTPLTMQINLPHPQISETSSISSEQDEETDRYSFESRDPITRPLYEPPIVSPSDMDDNLLLSSLYAGILNGQDRPSLRHSSQYLQALDEGRPDLPPFPAYQSTPYSDHHSSAAPRKAAITFAPDPLGHRRFDHNILHFNILPAKGRNLAKSTNLIKVILSATFDSE